MRMKTSNRVLKVARGGWPFLVALALAPACGDDAPSKSTPSAGEIGPAGGTVRAGELELVIPAGALGKSTLITIAPALGTTAADGREVALAFELKPDGLKFAVPAVAHIEKVFASAELDPVLYLSSDGSRWLPIADSKYEAGVTSGSIEHFSYVSVQIASMQIVQPQGGAGGASSGEPAGGMAGESAHLPAGGTGGGGEAGANHDMTEGGAGQGGAGAGQSGGPGAGGASSGAGGEGAAPAVTCDYEGSAPTDCEDYDCTGLTLCTGQPACVGGSDVVEQDWEWGADCSDGHRYFVMCGQENASSCECTCQIDDVVVGTCTYPMAACTLSQDELECDCPFPDFLDP